MSEDPLWYKDAVIYEVHIKSFCDSNGDGIGDFAGLTSKLPYLQELGVTALWILPFYPSPLKDDGYDIADYNSVNEQYGDLDDFKFFLDEAHRLGLKVITELVINHTSDQHEWFQKARKAPVGSPERDFYVWSDTIDKYRGVRIIFKDYETSNWAWDPVAKAYFWHRFYSHQPDLNYDNPAVQEAVIDALDFWLKLGVDGMRLDAIPYLYQREGTTCENLPETHVFLKKLRKHVDDNFDNRMFLAEANMWPEDAAQYFGDGDECQMNFHFPMMPRLFMAIRLEDRLPIMEIAEQTPEIPDNCQWALFLRNHDELTLEMVTDEERDYMYRVYAHDPQARINLGIRHRLAPLLKNDRRKIELMNSLLFSLTGTPVLYYGDEIGMGDNIYLGDRDGVRTPMQWSSDRNAGFSRANPQKLYLPVIIDPEYHYETINVENQQNNPNSLYWKTRQLIQLRKRTKAFSRGTTTFLQPPNRKVLAYIREYAGELYLIVSNLSRFVQFAELDLSAFQGLHLIELFGREVFPPIEEDPFFLTLSPYASMWFSIEKAKEDREETIPVIEDKTKRAPPEVILSPEKLFAQEQRTLLQRLLLDYLPHCPWLHEGLDIDRIEIVEVANFTNHKAYTFVLLIDFIYFSGEQITVQMIFELIEDRDLMSLEHDELERVVARLPDSQKPLLLTDVTDDPKGLKHYLDLVRHEKEHKAERGVFKGVLLSQDEKPSIFAKVGVDANFTRRDPRTLTFLLREGGVKLYTTLDEGLSVDVEMRRTLAEKCSFEGFSPLVGYVEYRSNARGKRALAEVIGPQVSERDNAWEVTVSEAERYFERIIHDKPQDMLDLIPSQDYVSLSQDEIPESVHNLIGDYLEVMRCLGEETADFHLALHGIKDDPAFIPEEFSSQERRSFYQNLRKQLFETLLLLREKPCKSNPELSSRAENLLLKEAEIISFFKPILDTKMDFKIQRYHGHYILEKLLYTGKNFVILDFDGNPFRSFSERRFKRSALRDVVSMLYSLFSAGFVALDRQEERAVLSREEAEELIPYAKGWAVWVGSCFLRAYLRRIEGSEILPKDPEHISYLLHLLFAERMLERLKREWQHRPERAHIPLEALLSLLPVFLKEMPE